MLVLGADTSSPLTDLAGWSFHFLNGIGFGIAYAMFGLGRNRWWAVGWAMALETATIVTPFVSIYGLAGKWHLIGIAYAAHVAYGLPLGSVVSSAPTAPRTPLNFGDAGFALAVLVAGLVVWHRPFSNRPVSPSGSGSGKGSARRVEGREFCFEEPGVHRVRLTDEPYSGGFVIVERRRAG